jgi:hypothetical protein
MKVGIITRNLATLLAASTLVFAVEDAAWAQHGGGHAGAAGGGVHGGGGTAGGGIHGGAIGGFHGGTAGSVHGGPGFHGSPGFRRGPSFRGHGWRWAPGWGWWWDWGWPLGVYLSVLPWSYSTLWWDGIPYYYADGGYYIWNDTIGQYEQVQPPSEIAQQGVAAAPGGASQMSEELFAYPTNGQSIEQQATDKSQCRAWANGQVGKMPTAPNGVPGPEPGTSPGNSGAAGTASTVPSAAVRQRQDYWRAEAACLEARGYSVE